MRNKKKPVIVGLITVLIAFFVRQAASGSIETGLHVQEIGSVFRGDNVEKEFFLENLDSEPVEIMNVKAACGCTTAKDFERVIMPGETWTLPVTLDTKTLRGEFRKPVWVSTTTPHQPPTRFPEDLCPFWLKD